MSFSKVYVEITNVCNKNCSFCPKTKRKAHIMTKDDFDIITDKLIGVTKYLYLHVMGEPTSHPLISEFIELGAKKGFNIAITTNGTLLFEKGDQIISSGAYKVNVSVHSFENGSEEDQITYLSQVCAFANKASENGVLTVLRLWNDGSDNGRNESILSYLRESLNGEWVQGSRGFRIRDKLHIEIAKRFDWPDLSAKENGSGVFCYGLKDHFGILSDGTVIPCCLDHEGDIALGNIFESSVEQILSSEKAQAMIKGFQNRKAVQELCRKCGYATRF